MSNNCDNVCDGNLMSRSPSPYSGDLLEAATKQLKEKEVTVNVLKPLDDLLSIALLRMNVSGRKLPEQSAGVKDTANDASGYVSATPPPPVKLRKPKRSNKDSLKRHSTVTEADATQPKRNSMVGVGNLLVARQDSNRCDRPENVKPIDQASEQASTSQAPQSVPTRSKLANLYDDNDERQNELIWMERAATNTGIGTLEQPSRLANLPLPLSDAAIKSKDWNFVVNFDRQQLANGMCFLSENDVGSIRRRHPGFPFSHPGPVTNTVTGSCDYFYADSIIQEVKLSNEPKPFYVVRWVGYEDIYNTVEPEAYLANTAVLTLYKKAGYATASRTNGPSLLRRSNRLNLLHALNQQLTLNKSITLQNVAFASSMKLLDEYLQIESKADRYDQHIGFHDSSGSVTSALKYQFNFIKKIFIPLATSISGHDLVVSNTYLGSIFGQNQAKMFKQLNTNAFINPTTIKCKIDSGLKRTHRMGIDEERYVAFFVFNKYNSHDTKDTKQMNMHAMVLTIRATDNYKDAVLHDPSPTFGHKWTPPFLHQAKKPCMRSRSVTVGSQSQQEDCLYQCFRYIIAMKTGEILNFKALDCILH